MGVCGCVSYSSDEAVKRLPPLCVLHCDRAQIITEPNGWDDASGVTVSHVFLMKKIAVIKCRIVFCLICKYKHYTQMTTKDTVSDSTHKSYLLSFVSKTKCYYDRQRLAHFLSPIYSFFCQDWDM